MKLKVCGLSNPNEIETCVVENVDYCGFILNYPKSHRFISYDKAKDLMQIEKHNSKFVGVLVNPYEKELENFSKLNLDYFQLYGNYDEKELIKIKKRFNKNIIGTVQVKKRENIEEYKKIESGSDIILWDSSGYEESLNWNYSWIKSVSVKVEKMIAGNITIDKIQNLIGLANTIDVSGALETNKVKDIDKIKEFTNEIRKINDTN